MRVPTRELCYVGKCVTREARRRTSAKMKSGYWRQTDVQEMQRLRQRSRRGTAGAVGRRVVSTRVQSATVASGHGIPQRHCLSCNARRRRQSCSYRLPCVTRQAWWFVSPVRPGCPPRSPRRIFFAFNRATPQRVQCPDPTAVADNVPIRCGRAVVVVEAAKVRARKQRRRSRPLWRGWHPYGRHEIPPTYRHIPSEAEGAGQRPGNAQ